MTQKRRKQPANLASPWSTGSGGPLFEVEVAAYFLAAMLTGERVLAPAISHQVTGIDWQTRDQGWLLDDLLIHLRDGSAEGSLALSAKSNHQVDRTGFPQDFVWDLWAHWNRQGTEVFEKETDFLGLVVGRLDSDVEDAWNDLLKAALLGDDPDRVAQRFTRARRNSNQLARQLFQSLHCPPDLGSTNPAETVRLIRRLRVLHLDFRNDPSRSIQQAFRMCQEGLEGHDPAVARNLWARLCTIASQRGPAGGSLRALLPELRSDFPLLAPLDDRADWEKLERFSRQGLGRAKESLASGLKVPRSEACQEIETWLGERRSTLVFGEAGVGKSALAKMVAQNWQSGSVVWLDPAGAQVEDLLALERKIGLRKPLDALLPDNPHPLSLLVLDALERWSQGGLDCAARLIEICSQTQSWVVLATARSDQQRKVLQDLLTRRVPVSFWSFRSLELPSTEDLRVVWQSFPELRRLMLRHPALAGILRNLKVLDWLSADLTLRTTAETASWGTPSQLIDGLWRRWIGSGPNRHGKDNTLQKIARLEADHMEASVARFSLQGSEVPLGELEDEELIRIEEERVSFRHDLIGDWARLRSLVAENPGALRQKLPDLALSPHWHSALRLFGQRLLEQGDSGLMQWLELYEALPSNLDSGAVAQGLLLDSLIFASNSDQLMERLWPQLIAGGGELLSRLLRRFLWVATVPHPQINELDEGMGAAARAVWRLPYWPYWGPVLKTLDHHRGDVATKAPLPGAEICGLWLQWTPQNWKWRQEAARIAMEIAKAHPDAEAGQIFESLLWAAPEFPEEVADLTLRLSQRKEDPVDSQEAETLDPHQNAPIFLHPRAGRLRPPYPDGPRKRIARGFREAVLNTGGLEGLISVRPETAREVLLACCLQEPRWESPATDRYLRDIPGVYEWMEGFPPMYFKGPFLRFLKLQPAEGVQAILQLVNQATTNYLAGGKRRRRRTGLIIRRRHLLGDEEVYRWFQHSSNNVIFSALTALEKWLYDEMDQGRGVEPAIRTILKRSRSVAFAGLLVEIGKKAPHFFKGALRPLLGDWRIYQWDQHAARGYRIGDFSWHGSPLRNHVQEWNDLPHRRIQFFFIALEFLLFDPQMEATFAEIRRNWTQQLESANELDQDEIQRLIARLDPENYQLQHRPDGTVAVSFQWPEPLREQSEQALSALAPPINAQSLAAQCSEFLEDKAPLDNEQAEAIWGKLLTTQDTKDWLREEQYADAMTGAIAALLLLPGNWAQEHGEQRTECKRLFLEVLEADPPADDVGHSSTLVKEHWPGFAAATSIALLAEDPTDPRLRRLTAMAIMSRWHRAETTEIAMSRGFLERGRLGQDWGRMQNLAVLWAALHSMGYHLDFQGDSLPHRWASRLVRWFVQEKIPAQLLDLKKLAAICRSLRNRFYNKEAAALEDKFAHPQFKRAEPASLGFNPHDLKSAFSWLPDLSDASSMQEREDWLNLYRCLLDVAVSPFLEIAQFAQDDQPEGLFENHLSDYTTWLVGRIATLTLQLSNLDERRSFWQPLFSPGAAARGLIGAFLRAWFYDGPSAAESPDHFVQCWEELIHYATGLDRNGQGGAIDWNLLMGLRWRGSAEFRLAVRRLLPLYQDWATKHLNDGRTVKQFARFLGAPAAYDLAPSGIIWLAAALPAFRDSRESNLDEAIVDLLRASWKRITTDPALREPFQALFAWAVQRGTPAALVLQEEVQAGQ